jgi:hypothetical protein
MYCLVCISLAEAWKLVTLLSRTVAQCGFQIDLVCGIDNSALKLTEDEENDWHSLQPLGLQNEDYMVFNSDVEFRRAQSVDQMFG